MILFLNIGIYIPLKIIINIAFIGEELDQD